MTNETESATHHLATVTWYGINDLANTPFVEVLVGHSEDALYRQCHIWAHCNLADGTPFKAEYLAVSNMPEFRENDPRKNIPIDTRHAMTPRQQANYDEAKRRLNIQDGDHATDDTWRSIKRG